MTDRSEGSSRLRLTVLLAVLVFAIAAVAAGCGGDDDGGEEAAPPAPPAETEAPADTGAPAATEEAGGAPSEPLKLAILSDCEGAFGTWYEADIGGAQAAFSKFAGGQPAGENPSDGMTGINVGGRDIEIVGYGCADDTADKAIEETRRLVEDLGAEVLIGPLSGDEGIAVANYAKEHPELVVLNGTSGAQDTTLKVQAPNFFRFNSDGAQWSAGLGDYAYNELGWRTAAVIGDDYSFPYTSLAGFVAEFCAIGGDVTARVWPPLGETDYSSYISQIPDDVDGVMVGIGGSGLVAFIKQYDQLKSVEGTKFMGNVFWPDPLVLGEVGALLEGGVAAGPTAGDSTDPAAVEYNELIDTLYPSIAGTGPSVFTYNYYNAAWALIQGLEASGGVAGQPLIDALNEVVVDGVYGQIELDSNRQAITDNYVQEVVATDDGFGVRTILKIPAVDQAFGGVFTTDTPSPDRENPVCEPLDTPPPWIGNAEPVGG
jgi:branched-chain amino acid transport system substrate-binding protein